MMAQRGEDGEWSVYAEEAGDKRPRTGSARPWRMKWCRFGPCQPLVELLLLQLGQLIRKVLVVDLCRRERVHGLAE